MYNLPLPQNSNMSQRKSTQMYPLIERWRSSGESKKDFCVQHHINLHTFTYWINKYDKSRAAPSDFTTAPSNFVSLQVNEKTKGNLNTSVEITYPNGIQLRLNSPPSLLYLQSLLQTSI